MKIIKGKNVVEDEFNKLVQMKDNDLKNEIYEQFKKSREERK